MSEILPPASNYRVIERPKQIPLLIIEHVFYDAKGEPIFHRPLAVASNTGDGLTVALNEVAMALTRPSLLESDFVRRPRLITPANARMVER